MKNLGIYLLFCILILSLLTGCPSMADKAITEFIIADLHGMIYDYHSQPCAQVRIRFDDKEGPSSDINGRFVLKDLSKGPHSITLSKDGYEEVNFNFEFTNRTQVLYIKLFSLNQLLELAENELDNKKLGNAEKILHRAEKIDAENAILLYLKAILALKRDQIEQSLIFLNSILEQGIIEPMVLLTIADIYQYYKKDTNKAIHYLKRYLHQEENPDVRKRLKELEQHSEKPASDSAVTPQPTQPDKPTGLPEPAVTPSPEVPDKSIVTPVPTAKPETIKPTESPKPPVNSPTG